MGFENYHGFAEEPDPPPMWGLSDALELVRALQPTLRPHFHVALGGGVLNRGYSDKDLDLFVMPMCKHEQNVPWSDAIVALEKMFGGGLDMVKPEYEQNEIGYRFKLVFTYAGKRIDVFVMGPRKRE